MYSHVFSIFSIHVLMASHGGLSYPDHTFSFPALMAYDGMFINSFDHVCLMGNSMSFETEILKWRFPKMWRTPKSSILIGFSILTHLGIPHLWKPMVRIADFNQHRSCSLPRPHTGSASSRPASTTGRHLLPGTTPRPLSGIWCTDLTGETIGNSRKIHGNGKQVDQVW